MLNWRGVFGLAGFEMAQGCIEEFIYWRCVEDGSKGRKDSEAKSKGDEGSKGSKSSSHGKSG